MKTKDIELHGEYAARGTSRYDRLAARVEVLEIGAERRAYSPGAWHSHVVKDGVRVRILGFEPGETSAQLTQHTIEEEHIGKTVVVRPQEIVTDWPTFAANMREEKKAAEVARQKREAAYQARVADVRTLMVRLQDAGLKIDRPFSHGDSDFRVWFDEDTRRAHNVKLEIEESGIRKLLDQIEREG